MLKKQIDWEKLYSLVHGDTNADYCDFCEHYKKCFGQTIIESCPIWASLPTCNCAALSKIAAAFNHFRNSTEQTMFDATAVINAVAEALGKPWEDPK